MGYFNDEIEAGKMYDKFVIQKHGMNASTNNLLTQEELQMVLVTPLILPKRRPSSYGTNIDRPNGKFRTTIIDQDGKKQSAYFDTHQEAINFRDARLQEIIHIKLQRISHLPIIRNSHEVAVIFTNLKSGTQREIKVDDEFYYEIMKFGWSVGNHGNPQARIAGKCSILPKFVLQLAGKIPNIGDTIDHIFHDYTDCRLKNLRYLSSSAQNQNRRKRKHDSKFIGIEHHSIGNTFCARIAFQKKRIYLGSFDSEIEAAKAYDKAVDKYYPDGMKNFPTDNRIAKGVT